MPGKKKHGKGKAKVDTGVHQSRQELSHTADPLDNGFHALQICDTTLVRSGAELAPHGLLDAEEARLAEEEGNGTTRKVSVGSLLATFYPKFENDSPDEEVWDRMSAVVGAGAGVLEVSVKHSGSLFMWAGAQRGAFSKNSYGNEYSAVGVWVLGDILKQAWGAEEGVQKQKELSNFLQDSRLSLAMELVTSVLGDHGQRPHKDYVVVTAVVELGRNPPRFMCTPDVVRLCRQWRLPSNQYWLFTSRASLQKYKAAYRVLSEEGVTRTVEKTMADIADITVPGTANHTELQGEIMEGLVARVVSRESAPSMLEVLKAYPDGQPSPGASSSLRELFASCDDNSERLKRIIEEAGPNMCRADDWAAVADVNLEDAEGEGTDAGDSNEKGGELLASFLRGVPADEPTRKLQEVLRTVKGAKMAVRLKCHLRPHDLSLHHPVALHLRQNEINLVPLLAAEHSGTEAAQAGRGEEGRDGGGGEGGTTSDGTGEAARQHGNENCVPVGDAVVLKHFVVTVHALLDSAFRKYQNLMRTHPGLWPLYRGFFVEAYVLETSSDVAEQLTSRQPLPADHGEATAAVGPAATQQAHGVTLDNDNQHLMLKMKFLPYKLRTFLIRNGLGPLMKGGEAAYMQHCNRLFKAWGLSPKKTKQMKELCNAWATYFIPRKPAAEANINRNYLDELEPFLKQYARASASKARAVGASLSEKMSALTMGEEEEEEHEESHTNQAPDGRRESVASDYEGVLVFFPGIPGCAKSAICEHLMQQKGGTLAGGREMEHLMGDAIQGKYWNLTEAKRKKNHKVMTLADKNAPNTDAWDKIERICEATGALGIPVVPESHGAPNNPFDMETLAVFTWRVLQRTNHPGGLDGTTPVPGSVLLLFYHLYDRRSREEFEHDLRGRFGSLVQIPVLQANRPPMPASVLDIMAAGEKLHWKMKAKNGNKKVEPMDSSLAAEWKQWDAALKKTMEEHDAHMRAVQVPLEDAIASVRLQLQDIIVGRTPIVKAGVSGVHFSRPVQFACIAVPQAEIWQGLQEVAQRDARVADFLSGRETEIQHQLHRSHVTLAHHRSHGHAAVIEYAALEGAKVQMEAKQLLFNKHCAALHVHWESGASAGGSGQRQQQQVVSATEFNHITIWLAPKAKAVASNDLPLEVECGESTRLEFEHPLQLLGKVELR
eukprot:TRINITY_DN18972_c0_g1_i1.p1 TRINITY_DN18972_c0_g1~~TRINITY_DN18972_c0_g1_i1.p1  ORF type:complete len:1171 (+),score=244.92 TRINITY_DN18972_c0_g1_i1:325-3837(+)